MVVWALTLVSVAVLGAALLVRQAAAGRAARQAAEEWRAATPDMPQARLAGLNSPAP